jgi:hypothetical protein
VTNISPAQAVYPALGGCEATPKASNITKINKGIMLVYHILDWLVKPYAFSIIAARSTPINSSYAIPFLLLRIIPRGIGDQWCRKSKYRVAITF